MQIEIEGGGVCLAAGLFGEKGLTGPQFCGLLYNIVYNVVNYVIIKENNHVCS
jgi:hypothetical protein